MYTWVSTDNDRAQWQSFVDAAKEKDPNFTLTFDGPAFNDYWTNGQDPYGRLGRALHPHHAGRPWRRSCPACLSLLDSYMEAAGIKAPTTTLR